MWQDRLSVYKLALGSTPSSVGKMRLTSRGLGGTQQADHKRGFTLTSLSEDFFESWAES
jgi:hypothetical protein